MDDSDKGFKPPYMAFQTFWGYLDELGKKTLPPRIDRSLMSTKSGTDQANLLAAFSAFGLVGEGQQVQPPLVALTSQNEDERKAALAHLLRTFYPAQVKVSEDSGTEQQLKESLKDTFGLDAPETRRKAMTFFLHAARTAGLQVSPHFPATRSGSGAPGAPKTPRKKAAPRSKPDADKPTPINHPATGDTYTVALQSGGTVSVVVDVNLFSLSDTDSDFVLNLVKNLKGYKQPVTAAATPQPSQEAT